MKNILDINISEINVAKKLFHSKKRKKTNYQQRVVPLPRQQFQYIPDYSSEVDGYAHYN